MPYAITVLLSLATISANDKGPNLEAIAREAHQTLADAIALLKGIQTRADAEKNARGWKELNDRYLKLEATCKKIPDRVIEEWESRNKDLANALEKQHGVLEKNLLRELDRLEAKVPDAYRVLQGSVLVGKHQESRLEVARAKILELSAAAKAFTIRNESKPKSLNDLRPFLAKGKEETFKDLWDKPIQFDVTGKNNGGEIPDIWTVSPYDGKTQIGNWRKK